MMQILVATNNARKCAELQALLVPLGHDVSTPAEVGGVPPVVEDRPTFAGNAVKKAVSAARARRTWALADDSGLEVDHLGGAPGVRSARFAGDDGDAERNNDALLAALSGVPPERRGARFVCVLVLARPDGTVAGEFTGVAHGRILEARRGKSGFGYDPLFLFTETGFAATGRSFAELSRAEKSAVSHRGRALRALADRLPALLSAAGPAPV
ncbi:MAG: non-canonical purine NTP pyrophosphatase [Planctomycetota bacterium]